MCTVALPVAEVEVGVFIHNLGPLHSYSMIKRQRLCIKHQSPLIRIVKLCKDVRVNEPLEVKVYACPP